MTHTFLSALRHFLGLTAWSMETPKPYGAFHLTVLLVGLGLSVWAAWRLRRIGEQKSRMLLFGIGVFLAVCEVYKQLFYAVYLYNGTYPWWIFPFQLCSVPMYLCLIAPLLRPGRVRQGMYSFMMIYNLLGGFMALMEPSGLVHPYWTLTLHAFLWHIAIVFVGLYLGFSGRGGCRMSDYRRATVTFLLLALAAFGMNVVICKGLHGSVNLFFVGPEKSSIVVFKDIAARFGWFSATAVYVPVVCLGAFLFFLPFYLCGKKRAALSKL